MLTALTAALSTQGMQVAHHWAGHGGGPHWWFFFISLTWIFYIFLFVFLMRRFAWRRGHDHPGYGPVPGAESGGRDAEEVLREDYARGDIDETEFRRRLEALTAHRRK